jgi:hypothetical protein
LEFCNLLRRRIPRAVLSLIVPPRLIVLADPKMLPALATGLREGGRFDVVPLALSDPGGAAEAAASADAVAIFYGAPGLTLAAVLESLAPHLRARGGRAIAVLQRDQAVQRDDCFRAGASDVLFMPMPKDQFVARLHAAVSLAYDELPGRTADVEVSADGSVTSLPGAVVTAAGLHAGAEVPFAPGATVRVAFAGLELWGLVACASPGTRIRFAGISVEEDANLRDFAGQNAAPRAAPSAPRAAGESAPRGAPVSGPPPGFAGRPRDSANPRATAARPAAPRAASPQQRAAGGGSLDDLFDAPGGAAPQTRGAAPSGPTWPIVPAVEACRAALIPLLRGDKNPPAGTPADVALAARKLAQVLSLAERSGIEMTGPVSAYGDAAVARVVLEAARSEGLRLASAKPPANVDDVAAGAVVQIADSAAARLQKDADAAIVKAQVEALQSIKAASAALSRDLLSFKEVADRLRGLSAAPRLGAGAGGLDPDVVVGTQPHRPAPQQKTEAPQIRPELKDFAAFHESPGRTRKRASLVVGLLLLGGGIANYMVMNPRVREVPREQLPAGVARVEVSGTTARVFVAPTFAEVPAGLKLIELLRDRHVDAAAVFTQTGTIAGQVDVKAGKLFMLAAPPKKAGLQQQDAPTATAASK